MTIRAQQIEKENRAIQIFDRYHFNPQRMPFVTEKPNVDPRRYNRNRAASAHPQRETADCDTLLFKTLLRFKEVPRNKQSRPLTEAQQIGWFSHVRDVRSFKAYSRVMSRESKFDEAYTIVKKVSQFSNKNKLT